MTTRAREVLEVLTLAVVLLLLLALLYGESKTPEERCDALGGRIVPGGYFHYCIAQPKEPEP